jgi:hypothetical protein
MGPGIFKYSWRLKLLDSRAAIMKVRIAAFLFGQRDANALLENLRKI